MTGDGAQYDLYCWDRLPLEELSGSISRAIVTGDLLMLAHVHLTKGALVPRHEHENEQFTYILNGHLRFWVGEEDGRIDVLAGEVLHLPAHLPHRAEAIEDTLDLDVFTPPRQDWLSGRDAYLRSGETTTSTQRETRDG